MNDRFLLDTNVVIQVLKGAPQAEARLAAMLEVFLPVVAAAELLYGAEKSARRSEQLEKVNQFLLQIRILPCSLDVARTYARINHSLRALGKPIPQNDMWIAAIAIAHGLTLITTDRHFEEIEGLSLGAW
ncbi:MAG: type II toxin-antitoxin system VapC family toxin [Pirellulales bacterium]